MGMARIVSGGPDGRYTIELDYGSSVRDARVAAIQRAITQLTARRVKAAEKLSEKTAKVQEARDALEAAIQSYAIAAQAGTAQELATAERAFLGAQQAVELAVATERPHKANVATIDLDLRRLNFQLAQYQNLQMVETRQAWCVDLTEDGTGFVGTCDVPGETDLILIAPGARPAYPSFDGRFVAREVLSPEHAFFNAAILPGWQKYRPTYRRGTIVALDYDNNLATVELAPATSSAQRLDVNQTETLENVPVQYMTCDAIVFEIDDRVVVMFEDQDWSKPHVIGFVDTPRGCGWACIGHIGLNTPVSIPGFANLSGSVIYATTSLADIDALLAATPGDVHYKTELTTPSWGRWNEFWDGESVFINTGSDIFDRTPPSPFPAWNSIEDADRTLIKRSYLKETSPGVYLQHTTHIVVCRANAEITGATMPDGFAGFVFFANVGNDIYDPGGTTYYGWWTELKIEVSGNIIFNAAATNTGYVGIFPDQVLADVSTAIRGGIKNLIGNDVGKLVHVLATDGG